MICTKCGADIPEDVSFCTNCGTPVQNGQQSTVSVSSVWEEQAGYVTPVLRPVKAGGYGFGGFIKRHVALLIAALAVVVLAVIAVINFPVIMNTASKLTKNEQDYYRSVEKKYIMNIASDTSGMIDVSSKSLGSLESNGWENVFSVVFEEKGEKLLSKLGESLHLDMSWLKKVELAYKAGLNNSVIGVDLNARLNGKDIAGMQYILNAADGGMYVIIPELNAEYYLKLPETGSSIDTFDLPYSEGSSEQALEMLKGMADNKLVKAIKEALPSESRISSMAGRYADVILGKIGNVTEETVTEEADGIEQKYTVITVLVDKATAESIILAVCAEMKKDEDIKKIITDFCSIDFASLGLEGDVPDKDTAYADFIEAVEGAEVNAGKIADQLFGSETLKYKVYVDNRGAIVGRTMEKTTAYDFFGTAVEYTSTMHYLLAVSGNKYGFEAYSTNVYYIGGIKQDSASEIKLSSNGTRKGSKLTGDVLFTMPGCRYSFSIENLDLSGLKKGSLSGKISLPFDAYSLSPLLGERTASEAAEALEKVIGQNVSFDISFDMEAGKKCELAFTALSDKEKVISVVCSSKTAKITNYTVPEESRTIDMSDKDQSGKYVKGISLDKLIKNLNDANVDSTIINAIEEVKKKLEAEMGLTE